LGQNFYIKIEVIIVKSKNKTDLRKLAGSAVLGSVATILMIFDLSVPFMPSFIKLDVSDLPALIGAFVYGPGAGVAVSLLKNLLHFITKGTTTGGVGELSNFLLATSFVLPAGMIYKKKSTRKGAIIASLIGSVVMALFSVVSNYYLVYPVYTVIMPQETIIAAYQAIDPNIDTLLEAIIKFNMPFTFIKGILNSIICILIYKPLSPVLKGN
jgi:riboflavin transporter FmnP